jgi:hypothetical protein
MKNNFQEMDKHTFAEPVGFSLLVGFINIRTLPFRVGTFKHNAVLVTDAKNCQDFRFDVPVGQNVISLALLCIFNKIFMAPNSPIALELLIGFENAQDIIGVALVNGWNSTKLLMIPRVALPVWCHNLFCK